MVRRIARRQRHVIVFARSPEYGRVKTRLAKEVGALAAWQFYRQATAALLKRLESDPSWCVWLAWTGGRRRGWPGKRRMMRQPAGGLGERMERCLRMLPPGDAVLLGSDIPGVSAGHIRRAFTELRHAPLVFGPANDGGFWLVGARRVPAMPRPLFAGGVRWSSSETLGDAVAGLRVPHALAERMNDVDHASDLIALRGRRMGGEWNER